jgi:uncharacterized DUF497 family protein
MQFDGFDRDEGNWPKCAKHGVSKDEIEFILTSGPIVLPDRTYVGDEARYNAVGVSDEGRHIFIVFTYRHVEDDILIRPLSARYMHKKEVDRYEQTKTA